MSKMGFGSWVIAGFLLAIFGFFKFVAMRSDAVTMSIAIAALVFVAAAILIDRSLYFEFLTMRTTKHGMNMGALILLTIVLLTSLNYIVFRHNKSFDMTQEGLNSLSDQSIKILGSMKDDLTIKFFYDLRDQESTRDKMNFRDVVSLYQEKKNNIKYEAVSSTNNPGLAKEYGVNSLKGVAFVEYKGNKSRLQSLDETGMTTALINVSREKKKVIYFTKGHGEWSLEPDAGVEKVPDISELKQALIDSGYEVKALDLIQTPKIPDDASVIAIAGPKQMFLTREIDNLKAYAKAGGHLFIAIDPGVKHNLTDFLKTFGVDFTNYYVLDALGQQVAQSAAISLGMDFSSISPVTKGFRSGNEFVLFNIASSLKQTNPVPNGLVIDNLVKTTPASLAMKDLPKGEVRQTAENKGPHIIAMEVKGKFAPTDTKEFSAVVFADSDFLYGGFFRQDPNRNIALNSFAYLSKDSELISIRPKTPNGVNLVLTGTKYNILIWGIYVPMMVLLYAAGVFTWLRRRAA